MSPKCACNLQRLVLSSERDSRLEGGTRFVRGWSTASPSASFLSTGALLQHAVLFEQAATPASAVSALPTASMAFATQQQPLQGSANRSGRHMAINHNGTGGSGLVQLSPIWWCRQRRQQQQDADAVAVHFRCAGSRHLATMQRATNPTAQVCSAGQCPDVPHPGLLCVVDALRGTPLLQCDQIQQLQEQHCPLRQLQEAAG